LYSKNDIFNYNNCFIAIVCKNRWNNIRNQYRRRAINRNKITSGQAAQKKFKNYKYEDNSQFSQGLQKRDTITNFTCNLSDSSEEDGEIHDARNDTNTNANLKTNQSVNDDIWKKPNTIKNKQSLTTGSCQQPETASIDIMKYLLEKKEASKESDIDPVDAFLKGIGATLKTFNPYSLNLAKSRIFNTVQEIELSQILNKQSCAPNRNQPSPPVSSNLMISTSQSLSPQTITQPDDSIFAPVSFTTIGNEEQHQ